MDIKSIQVKINEGESLKELAGAYGEIASNRINQIRSQVERNRLFFNELSDVFTLIERVAQQKGVKVKKPKDTIAILISSNNRFYGSIDNDLIHFFLLNSSKFKTDRLIIGQTGLEYFKSINYSQSYQKKILQKDLPSPQELQQLSEITKEYKTVVVFYSELKSVLLQVPKVKLISGLENKAATGKVKAGEHSAKREEESFIVEPDIDKMLEFFESQIGLLLLEQTFLEAELARTASRLISMDHAQVEAKNYIKQSLQELAFAKRSIDNNELLESIASRRKQMV